MAYLRESEPIDTWQEKSFQKGLYLWMRDGFSTNDHLVDHLASEAIMRCLISIVQASYLRMSKQFRSKLCGESLNAYLHIMKDRKMHLEWGQITFGTKGHPISDGLLENRVILSKNTCVNGMQIAVVDEKMKKYRVQSSCRHPPKKRQGCGSTEDQHIPFAKQ